MNGLKTVDLKGKGMGMIEYGFGGRGIVIGAEHDKGWLKIWV